MVAVAAGANAQTIDSPTPTPTPARASQPVDQIIYRGVLGNLLENIPLDSDKRVELQRANAVVSNTFLGRTLAVLMGVAAPVLMVGGLAWGAFAASRIRAPAQSVEPGAEPSSYAVLGNEFVVPSY